MTLLTVLSLKLQVTQAQIKKCLALAPVYTLSIIFVSLLLYILIQNAFDFTAIYELKKHLHIPILANGDIESYDDGITKIFS